MSTIKTRILGNTSALLTIQCANALLPLLLIPYLTRTLGVSLYGVVAFGLAAVQIACVVTDYGFGLSATYRIAQKQSDIFFLRRMVSAVFICKAALLLLVLAILSCAIATQQKYDQYEMYFWILLLTVIGQTFQPVWFFQGIERMVFITLFIVMSRLLYLGLVLWWVSSPEDYYWVATANGVGALTAALIGIIIMAMLGYSPLWCGWKFVKETFFASTEFFWSRAAVALYTAGGAFYLGLVATPFQVAYYSAAEQLYRGAQSFFSSLSQALLPHMTKNKDISLFFRIMVTSMLSVIIGLVAGMLYGKLVLNFFFGANFVAAFPVLVVFLLTFLVAAPSILLGYPFLGALGNTRAANASVTLGGILQLALLTVLFFNELGNAFHVAVSVLGVELFVLCYRIYFANKLRQEISTKAFHTNKNS